MKFIFKSQVTLKAKNSSDSFSKLKEDLEKLSNSLKRAGIYHRLNFSNQGLDLIIYAQTVSLSEHLAAKLFKENLHQFFKTQLIFLDIENYSEFSFELELLSGLSES